MTRVDLTEFESRYRKAEDPWAFASSAYELGKYNRTIGALAAPRYSRCFEPACSIGVLTERLAERADVVVGCDASARAIEHARVRLQCHSNVELVTGAIPEWWPEGEFDLVVLSELGYYWDLAGWGSVIERCQASLVPSGEVIAVHWLGSSDDHLMSGWAVHAELRAHLGEPDVHVESLRSATDPGFVLERWTGVGRA